jgi:hypothetical protein
MTSLPCKDCICLPICKPKYLHEFENAKTILREFTAAEKLGETCSIIVQYALVQKNGYVSRVDNYQIYTLADFMQGIKK